MKIIGFIYKEPPADEAVSETKTERKTEATSETEAVRGTEAERETEAVRGTEAVRETEAVRGTEAERETEAVHGTEAVRETEAKRGWEMVLKGDSCLLNGRKPMFMPDRTNELGATECIILRVSRLGKEIETKFAGRYYDAVAPGVDFAALDRLREAQAKGEPWTSAIAFDYSLAIGEWVERSEERDTAQLFDTELVITPEEAIAAASRVMTIRQGDLIYIQAKHAPRLVQREEVITADVQGEEKLYCKIK